MRIPTGVERKRIVTAHAQNMQQKAANVQAKEGNDPLS
jgi:hypothetical protein